MVAESSGVFRSLRAGLYCSMTVHASNWSQVTSSHSQRWGEGTLYCPLQMWLTMWRFTLKVTRVKLIPSFFVRTSQVTGTVNRQTFLVFSVGVELLDHLLCPFPNSCPEISNHQPAQCFGFKCHLCNSCLCNYQTWAHMCHTPTFVPWTSNVHMDTFFWESVSID